ncbi:MAG: nitrogen fixation protein NifB, partial [Desulfotalea sp.]
KEFQIWAKNGGKYEKIDERKTAQTGGGIKRWHQLAKILGDCKAVLVSGVGQTPRDILTKAGTKPIEASGFIEDGLEVVFENKANKLLKGRKTSCADATCLGTGGGCG